MNKKKIRKLAATIISGGKTSWISFKIINSISCDLISQSFHDRQLLVALHFSKLQVVDSFSRRHLQQRLKRWLWLHTKRLNEKAKLPFFKNRVDIRSCRASKKVTLTVLLGDDDDEAVEKDSE